MSQLVNLVRNDPERARRTRRVSAEFSAKLSEHPARVDDTGSFKTAAAEDSRAFAAAAEKAANDARDARLARIVAERNDLREEVAHLRALIDTAIGGSERERVLIVENRRLREERRQREGR